VKRANRAVLLPMIVILHARQNARWSTKLGDDLVAHLGQAWLDRQEIDPANLTEQLRYLITEVDEDDALLLIISEHSVSLCQNEEDLKAYVYLLHELQRKGAHVLLLQQAACIVPPALANGFELIDFQSNYRQGIRNVVERIYVSNERNRTQGIPGVLRSKIEDTLLRCASFENNTTLTALFVDSRLIQWQGQLPEATSAEERVKLITDFLFNRRDSQGQNGLGLILDVLAETHPPNDACRQQLFELASEIYDLTRR
jgi:hypothetical protein